jgi:hypothetical protein
MIQIIGFLLCAMLAIKLLEISANSALRREDGKAHHNRTAALILGWPCVFGFAFWLVAQGGAFAEPVLPPLTAGEQACIGRADSADAAEACAQ